LFLIIFVVFIGVQSYIFKLYSGLEEKSLYMEIVSGEVQSYCCLFVDDQSRSFTSTLRHFAISSRVSSPGCDVFVHHLLTVAGSLPSCSASHLLVFFRSASTTFNRLMSSRSTFINNCVLCKDNEFLGNIDEK